MRSAVNSGNKILTDGLVLYLDVANSKSYINSATTITNLLSNDSLVLYNNPSFINENLGVLDFDGVDDYLANGLYPSPFSNNVNFDFEYTDSFSLSLWLKFDILGVSHPLINKYNSSINKGYFFLVNNLNQIRFGMQSQGGQIFEKRTTDTLNTNQWYNIVATYDGSNTIGGLNIYINGNLGNLTTIFNQPLSVTLIDPNYPLEIGRLGTNFGYLNGKVSNVSIYNKELSPSEVLQNYNALKYRFE